MVSEQQQHCTTNTTNTAPRRKEQRRAATATATTTRERKSGCGKREKANQTGQTEGRRGGTGRRVVMRDAKRDARQKHKLISCRSYLHTMPAPGGCCCLPCFARPSRIRRTYTVISWGTAILEDSCAHGKEENEENERLVTERERGREVGDQW